MVRFEIGLHTELFEHFGAHRSDGADGGPCQRLAQFLGGRFFTGHTEQVIDLGAVGKQCHVGFAVEKSSDRRAQRRRGDVRR